MDMSFNILRLWTWEVFGFIWLLAGPGLLASSHFSACILFIFALALISFFLLLGCTVWPALVIDLLYGSTCFVFYPSTSFRLFRVRFVYTYVVWLGMLVCKLAMWAYLLDARCKCWFLSRYAYPGTLGAAGLFCPSVFSGPSFWHLL